MRNIASQMSTLSCTRVSNMFNTDLSIMPLACGWYGVVIICLICNSSATPSKISFTNYLPWSVTNVLKTLCLHTAHSNNTLATARAVFILIGSAIKYLVLSMSMKTKQYLYLLSELPMGPIKSTCKRSEAIFTFG